MIEQTSSTQAARRRGFDDDFEPFDIDDAPSCPPNRYLDRELSWLAFNQRVLELAEDPPLPVLERANFLAIFASNLDEFFMVRVAGLKRRIVTGLAVPTNVGRAPHDVLADISREGARAAGAPRRPSATSSSSPPSPRPASTSCRGTTSTTPSARELVRVLLSARSSRC